MAGIEGERLCLRGGGCGAMVRWVLTVHHRRLDLDVDPDPNGTVIIITLPDGSIRAKVLCGPEMPAQQKAFRMHKCPPKRERPGPACAVCGLPMPRDIAIREGWVDHPGCDQTYQRDLSTLKAAGRRPR